MKNREVNNHGLVESDSQRKQLAYTPEIKEFVKDTPGVLKESRDVIEGFIASDALTRDNFEHASDPYIKGEKVVTKNDIEVTYVSRNYHAAIFKVKSKNRSFFVKRQDPQTWHDHGGFNEVRDTAEAFQERLVGLVGVRVVQPKLGYTDTESKVKYFVSDWEERDQVDLLGYMAKNYNRYIVRFSQDNLSLTGIKDERLKSIVLRYNEIKKRLSGYYDVDMSNMFYDESRDEIVVFDLNKDR